MHAILCAKPYICFIVDIVSRYQSNLDLKHWTIAKHILKCLRRMRSYMLMFQSIEIVQRGDVTV